MIVGVSVYLDFPLVNLPENFRPLRQFLAAIHDDLVPNLGLLFDPFNERVYIFSHSAPNATVINASDGTVVGTIDLGGAPEQAATDGQGHLYVDLENKDQVAVVDAKTMAVTAHYDLGGTGLR